MKEKVCGVTGHREIPAEYMEQAEQGLRREIEKAIADGYTYFISGFADGADQLFAGIVLQVLDVVVAGIVRGHNRVWLVAVVETGSHCQRERYAQK